MPRRTEKSIQWKVNIPEELAGWFELYLTDRAYHRPKYGERSRLITDLLYQHRIKIEAELVNRTKAHA